MARLPDTTGMKDEIVVARDQRNGYDHALRAAGARLVEVGLPDRASGAGLRGAEAWELAEAIGERTAAVFHVAEHDARPPLAEVIAVAHERGVPVIVDAAAQLPPQANLRRYIADGADLVAFSGGKAIGGPQASGILCGRRELIMAAALQQMDLDVVAEFWDPPTSLIDRARLREIPRHGVGRSCKVGKEEIAGLLTALELFVAEGDAARHQRWLADAHILANGLGDAPTVTTVLTGDDSIEVVPKVELCFPRGQEGQAAHLIRSLQDGEPSIAVDPTHYGRGIVILNPMCLTEGDAEVVVRAVLERLR